MKRIVLKPIALWTTVAALVFVCAVNLAPAANIGSIEGRWVGRWQNSNGSAGPDQLEVTEYPQGEIAGVWGKGYYIYGQRRGPDTYSWEAESEGSLYHADARLVAGGHGLFVNYTVLSHKNGAPREYRGISELRRARF